METKSKAANQINTEYLEETSKNLCMVEENTLNVFSIRNPSTHASSKSSLGVTRQDVSFKGL